MELYIQEILNNYDNFVSGLTNKSFFEELKLILISRVTEKIIKLINEVLDREIIDVNIVLNADILETHINSNIRGDVIAKDSSISGKLKGDINSNKVTIIPFPYYFLFFCFSYCIIKYSLLQIF